MVPFDDSFLPWEVNSAQMPTLYNEHESYAAAWLRRLVARDHLSKGLVDQRDVRLLRQNDLAAYDRVHLFAGIGGWDLALSMSGWPSGFPVWTGSCPCQPFSVAGRNKGTDDKRHLWPDWLALIQQCQPAIIFGEQVASPAGLEWFGAVASDLEASEYSVGAADLCAASVGAPHIRQRLYFVAIANSRRHEVRRIHLSQRGPGAALPDAAGDGTPILLGNPDEPIPGRGSICDARSQEPPAISGDETWSHDIASSSSSKANYWSDAAWIGCADGKQRPIEPGTLPLAHGVPQRMGRLRAYGNAIVPQVASAFITSVIESLQDFQ